MGKFKPQASKQVAKDLLPKRGKITKLKNKSEALKESKSDNEVLIPEVQDAVALTKVKKGKWTNKQRVLVFGSRGIPFRGRHLMLNLRRLMPHSKKESKMDKRDTLFAINEIAEMKNCNKAIFLEGRKNQDIYMWVSEIGNGPSAKFLVENMSTMEELKYTGNCLKGSRAILSFDPTFDSTPHWKLMKELFIQTFGTPNHHPKSQPFIDHVLTFTILDNRIWFRNFQIMEEDGSLVEIGPRFTLNPIRLFEGSFVGQTFWNNPHFVSPNKYRAMLKKATAGKYLNRLTQKQGREHRKMPDVFPHDRSSDVFKLTPGELENGVDSD